MEYEHRDFKNMIFRYLSDSLDADEREVFERHIETCPECKKELSEARELNAALDSLALDPPEALRNGAMARIKAEKRNMHLRRLWRIALPAAMLTVVISVSAAYTFLRGNKHNFAQIDGGFRDTEANEEGSSAVSNSAAADIPCAPGEREPDIFFFFTSEGYLQGRPDTDNNCGNCDSKPDHEDAETKEDQSKADIAEPDNRDTIVSLPDDIDSSIIEKFRMQLKLVCAYTFIEAVPDGIGEPMLVYQYQGYKVLIFRADDPSLPANMTTLYPDGDFSLVIIG